GGRIWERTKAAALAAVSDPFPAYSRELAILRLQAGQGGQQAATALKRLDTLRELAKLLVLGGGIKLVQDSFPRLNAELSSYDTLETDKGERRRRILEQVQALERAMVLGETRIISWTLATNVGPGDYVELSRRYGLLRRLLIDIQQEIEDLTRKVSAG
ncbi:MAG: hypothetical protein V3T77_01785, partial [Planctomycetota bacterium]